ncbi:aspartate aminotransferase family protein [Marivivens niveibacter]|uniref:Aspartate aminotransferase family protein n=1 Tax=Marivivens niveibacter TaxID=1930667 RepID=A0A251X2Q3_9RHOB|nr:aspartate aminotransferase family protein [Marivivens niveibacter]OUD11009.1 aspartate aminotransferase family protein [Marivivens niveibacter]
MTLISTQTPTAELQALDSAHHMHPFTQGAGLAEKGARVITRAEGVWLTDSEGHRILDAMAGLWCVNIGYGHDSLAEVAAQQMKELPYYNTFFQTTHVPVIQLANKLAEIAPGDLNHVFFANSGSEANDTNLRMVRAYWHAKGEPDRQVVISRKNAYHGSTMAGMSLGGMAGMHSQGGIIQGIHHINQPNYWLEGGDMTPEEFGLARARELEDAILEIGPEKVAAFIGEPVQGAGGVIVAPDTYWPEVQRIIDKYGILFISDEVICGFGRTGNWFGFEYYGTKPDIITTAKGLSSGYIPIAASIVSDKVASVIDTVEFNHGYTYSGHPVAAAVALENLRIMEDMNLVDYVKNDIAPYLAEQWHALGDHPMVGDTKIVGMMASLALTPNKDTRAVFKSPAGTIGYMTRECCFGNDLIMRHVGDRMVVSPPLVITRDEVDELIKRARKSLDEAYEKIKAAGLFEAA